MAMLCPTSCVEYYVCSTRFIKRTGPCSFGWIEQALSVILVLLFFFLLFFFLVGYILFTSEAVRRLVWHISEIDST